MAIGQQKPDPLQSLGIEPFIPSIPPVVGEVVPDSPAAKSGLQNGDIILSVNGKSFKDWLFLVDFVQKHPDKSITLTINRNKTIQEIMVHTGSQENKGKIEGFLGVRSQKVKWPAHWLRLERQDPITAIGTALKQTTQLTTATFTLMGRLVMGKLGLNSISGPVGIAQGAGDSGRNGLAAYLFFLH